MRREFYNDDLRRLIQARDPKAVVSECQRLLQELRSLNGDHCLESAFILDHLAQAYFEMGDYEVAISVTKDVLRLDKSLNGEVNADYARNLSNIGMMYRRVGRTVEAEVALTRALELIDKLPSKEQWERSTVLINMSYLEADRHDFSKAQRLLILAAKDRYDWGHPKLGMVYYSLGQLFRTMGKLNAAERTIHKALRVHRAIAKTKDSEYAAMLTFLGEVQTDLGQYEWARKSFLTALTILVPMGISTSSAVSRIRENLTKLPIGRDNATTNSPNTTGLL